MPTYIALLRGINVSGQKMIKMPVLVEIFEKLKFKNVRTYIQTGNIIFESSEKNEAKLEQSIEAALKKALDHDIPTLVRSTTEIETTLKKNPFKKVKQEGQTKVYFSFLKAEPDTALAKALLAIENPVDELRLIGRELYILCRKGYGTSKFSNNFVEAKLKVAATTRNTNTTEKILELMNGAQ